MDIDPVLDRDVLRPQFINVSPRHVSTERDKLPHISAGDVHGKFVGRLNQLMRVRCRPYRNHEHGVRPRFAQQCPSHGHDVDASSQPSRRDKKSHIKRRPIGYVYYLVTGTWNFQYIHLADTRDDASSQKGVLVARVVKGHR